MSTVPPAGNDVARTQPFVTDQGALDDDSGRQLARNVALANELLSCGMLSERQVSDTLADWSLYGAVSLRQHLENKNLLSADQLADLDRRVEQAVAAAPPQSPDPGSGNAVASTIMRFDSTGRVARLLGVSSSAGAVPSNEIRSGLTRYRLLKPIGQGGLGRVWLARDLALQRLVALKEIAAVREHPVAVQRFRNEAEITGRLEHPGIVPVYQLAEDADSGRSYYTMRFLGKATLQDSIDEYHERRNDGDDDPMLLQHLLVSFVSVCHAIGHAHSRKVMHRDLKPENVVIDSFGQVIVIDWGLAKLFDEAEIERVGDGAATVADDAAVTTDGQVLGTPLYMAPEQAAGRVDEVDDRTDIYGLGAILFAICTGRPPHEAAHARSTASGRQHAGRALLSEIASGIAPRANELNPQVDPALAAICSKAMARRRYARYQQAAELAEDVQRWMAGQPVSAYQETAGQRVRRWIRSHERLSQLLAGLIAVAFAAGVTLAMAAKQSHDAAQQELYHQAVGDAREIEIQLRDAAMDIGKDARFMASLPPIQAIIRIRAGDAGESEDVWLERLQTIYLGLLQANPDYLAVTFVAAGESTEAGAQAGQGARADEPPPNPAGNMRTRLASTDVVRVERNASDRSYIRAVPQSRLAATDDDQLLAEVIQQELGDVQFSLEQRPQQAAHSEKTRRLIAAVPVFDESTGDPFGMVMIEADLNAKLVSILESLGDVAGEAWIGQAGGEAWISISRENAPRIAPPDALLIDECPETEALAAARTLPFEITDGETYYGIRFRDNPNSQGVTVFVRVLDDD